MSPGGAWGLKVSHGGAREGQGPLCRMSLPLSSTLGSRGSFEAGVRAQCFVPEGMISGYRKHDFLPFQATEFLLAENGSILVKTEYVFSGPIKIN